MTPTRILLVAVLLALSGGCAAPLWQTIHEYCTENVARYKDYDQCYQENYAIRHHRRRVENETVVNINQRPSDSDVASGSRD